MCIHTIGYMCIINNNIIGIPIIYYYMYTHMFSLYKHIILIITIVYQIIILYICYEY